jgi:hypothetical protein
VSVRLRARERERVMKRVRRVNSEFYLTASITTIATHRKYPAEEKGPRTDPYDEATKPWRKDPITVSSSCDLEEFHVFF